MAENNSVIHSAAVIGAGTMGRGIAYLLAQSGIRTVLYNRNGNNLNQAREYILQDLDKRVAQGKISPQKKGEVLANLIFSAEFDAIADSDLVIESIAEQEQTKLEILAAISAGVKAETIIATNTSSLSLNKLATAVAHGERFIGLHFFNPAPLMKLIEIIPAYFTSQSAIQRCQRLVEDIGKQFVVCKATPGFIVNRMARPFYLEGFRLLEENVAQAAQIDSALKAGGRFRMGPLELTDFIGQDINYQVSRQIWQDMQYDPRYTPGHLQRSLVDAGLLGKKNGRSFFTAATAAHTPPAVVEAFPDVLRFHGSHPLFALLQHSAQAVRPALRWEHQPEQPGLGAFIQVDEAFIIKVTDGRTANQLADHSALDVFVVDAALDYADTPYLVAAHNQHARQANKSLFLNLLHSLIPQVEFIKDSPALIVARVIGSLINESVIMVESGVCRREDIDIAAVAGVNYANGIFDWLALLGQKNVKTLLDNMAQLLHSARYYPHYSLLNVPRPALATAP
ncbi:3-hydroxyacyl-CoA dehydrogenase NAD-binding domain-containing protein [Serratia entomophila]|uniref:3-hydroxyacyl-CoA dehydrogenase NAD-binding domain-containing protein n=1 Tax=Serratia entomophila TaxID=42906 RepID=UPI00217C20DE|nr:3-hydroxyacyl-CoA dehydrogenase NAD-binding domain-containing protein [Serratia entomophila]CAI0949607.1 Probable 3-hydroxybutyryl-CoA dehydrogenase [Serratia entomophila]CAI1643869.1 Probable 3-hydroxybutyryl-CoA dehydrogenase [Serratia entomophila]CAI1672203.1 Probable 3-hydroxybutyryl-CoA dehydrogenase [Serratia entomophila]CAI1682293.1 Probable 3-hydroxybutyryl-CoA dehydrogenase [Serratia entomophila]CAI1764657.1 Probable 3-hydroxybutyryl-CoA dehydrogenase [Serratia entomophila]